MKKIILLLFQLILGTCLVFPQGPPQEIVISGRVLSDSGKPVPNYFVYIVGDSSNLSHFLYHKTVKTDINGIYSNTILIPNNIDSIIFFVCVYDCNSKLVKKTLFYGGFNNLTADFTVCIKQPLPPQCKADFIAVIDSTQELTYKFIDKSAGKNISEWLWEFNNSIVIKDKNPIHKFPSPGSYYVCLTITSLDSNMVKCQDRYCKYILVKQIEKPLSCKADFSYEVNTDSNLLNSYKFWNTSKTYNLRSNHVIKYLWNFGDGQSSYSANPTHNFPEPDYYNICLQMKIVLRSDTNTILCESKYCASQVLIGKPKYYNIGGQVFGGKFPITQGKAEIYRIKANKKIVPYQVMNFDTLGYYYFYKVMEGNYYIRIVPSDIKYFPTYYGNVIFWRNALKISLKKDIFNANIELVASREFRGKGRIRGIVNIDTVKSNTNNIAVMLTDKESKPINYTWTNDYSAYYFENLAFGTYNIYTERAGWFSLYKTVTLDEKNSDVKVDMTINSVLETTESNISGNQNYISDVYPNPVSNMLNIDIGIMHNSALQIDIINITGIILYRKEATLETGDHKLSFDTDNLSKGIYFLRIYDENSGSFAMKKFLKN